MIWQWLSWTILALVLIAAAICDLRRGNVYNWLTYPAVVVGLALGVAAGAAEGSWREGFFNHSLGRFTRSFTRSSLGRRWGW